MIDPHSGSRGLRSAALFSAISLGLGFGYSQIIRFISSIILARLLFPEAFGLMAMVATVVTGLQLFSDLGIRSSVVHNPRGDDATFLNTAWTMQILRGFVLWLGACLLAWPAAYWRPDPAPDLLWMLPVIGFTAVLEGFTSTKLFTLSRHIAQGREVLIEIVAQTIGVATTILLAIREHNVVVLVIGQLVTATLKMLLTHALLPGLRNRLCWDRAAVRDLTHFAKWVYLGTMFTFIAQYADRLVVGWGSIPQLGIYNFAKQLADIPAELLLALGGKLIFPIYSRLLRSDRDLHAAFPPIHRTATAISALLLAGILATGSSLVHCLYDQRYQAAAWIFPLLAVGAWFRMLESNAGTVFFAQGWVRFSAYSNAAKAASLVIAMPLGQYLDGLRGLILGFIAGDLIRYAFTVAFLYRRGFFVLRNDLAWTIFVAITALVAYELSQSIWPVTLEANTRSLEYIPQMAVEALVVILTWFGVVGFIFRRRFFRKPPSNSLVC